MEVHSTSLEETQIRARSNKAKQYLANCLTGEIECTQSFQSRKNLTEECCPTSPTPLKLNWSVAYICLHRAV